VPRSTYYQRQKAVPSKREQENKVYTERIRNIYEESKQRYGAPNIHHVLDQEGVKISLKRVQRLMNKACIRSITKKKYKPQTDKQPVEDRQNLLEQDFKTTELNQKWVADITYIYTLKDGWCYLATVMDLHSRKIIGYCFSRQMTTDTVLTALENAYSEQKPISDLILHTDLGSQYTSMEFEERLQELGIQHSFSRKGCPYDNACIESFHAILKKEEVNHVQYLDFESAKLALFRYIEGWYNRKRIHGSIGYMTPQAFEDQARKSA
jgi:putative transposase